MIDQLIRRYHKAALHWAYRRLGDEEAARDAVQEAFVEVYQNLHRLRRPEAFSGWLRRIVESRCSRMTRRKEWRVGREGVAAENEAAAGADPESLFYRGRLEEGVRQALARLPERERVAARLHYFEGYAQPDIARMLGLPLTTVKKRLHSARRRMRGWLDERPPGANGG